MNDTELLDLLLDLPGVLVALPILGALAALIVPRRLALAWATLVSLGVFGLSLPLWFGYGPGASGVRFEVELPWFELLNAQIQIHLGVDGISVLLVLLSTFLTPLALLSAPSHIQERRREFAFWILLAQAGILGTLLALDLVLFYLCWELTLIPVWFLIGIWGGSGRRFAALKFLAYNMAGSLLMLGAVIYVILHSQQAGPNGEFLPGTTQILELSRRAPLPWTAQAICFLACALGLAIKLPLFPFHAWVADAKVEAPTSASVLLAGLLLKLGAYGLVRLCLPLFPAATRLFAPWILGLALIGIIYGALVAWAQRDLKRLLAFGSFSQLGLVALGVFALDQAALTGSLIQMVNHGLAVAALLFLAGMLQERRRTREIEAFGGLAAIMPRFGFCLMLALLASIGLPGTGGFVGTFLVLAGTFRQQPVIAVLATAGLLLGAVCLVSMARRVLFGPPARPENQGLPDLGWRESALLAPILVLIFWIGLFPAPFTGRVERSLADTLQRVARFEPPAPGVR